MKLIIASDHGGFRLKQELCRLLREKGLTCIDAGTHDSASVDYPHYAIEVGQRVASGEFERGILVCGTGIGMSIAANKVAGIRAALVHDLTTARLAAQHNNANVLCLGGRLLAAELALDVVEAWLETPFEERHQRRLNQIHETEKQNDAEKQDATRADGEEA